MRMLPLDGITVVAIEQAVAAPFATRQLADLGARVIKIERPGTGDFARHYDETVHGLSSHFVWLNRSKESLTLNLKQPEAKPILTSLLERADVFVQNLAPGASDRLGLGVETLRSLYPRLIICNISGYGSSGPYRDKKAYDLLVQAETGLISINGSPDAPAKLGISVADISAGMYAYSGVLTALFQRERTGEGTAYEVSLFESLGEWMGFALYYTAYGGSPPERTGASHAVVQPYGPFQCGDGESVYLGVQNSREWERFCEVVLDQPQIANDPRFDSNTKRVANREALTGLINERFDKLSSDQVTNRLEQAGIANAHLNSIREFWEHPQLKARDRWREVDSEAGRLQALLPPVTVAGSEPRMDPIPGVGEQTDQILRSLGYANEEIRLFRAAGII